MQTPFPMQEQFVDFYRNGIKSATDFTQASLNNGLKLQEKQIELVKTMIDENQRSAERLGEARSMQDLVTLQSRLATEQMQRMAQFWSTMWQTAAENGQAMFGQMREQMQSQGGRSSSEFAARIRETAPANNGKQDHRKSA